MKKTFLFLLPALLPAALLAADMTFEGRWLVDGVPQATNKTTCTVQFYESDDATNNLATTTGVAFRSGPDGRFVIVANVPTNLPGVFWAGVTPQGKSEIAPRMRVAPVPYVLAAAEAELVTNATSFELTGTATIGHLETAGDLTVTNLVVPGSGATLETADLALGTFQLEEVALQPGASLRLFDAGSGTLSPRFYQLSTTNARLHVASPVTTNKYLAGISFGPNIGISQDYVYMYSSSDASGNRMWKFDSDGILLMALNADWGRRNSPPTITVSIDKRSFTFTPSQSPWERFLSIPYRAGETIKVSATVFGTGGVQDNLLYVHAQADAKVRLVRFGLPQ